MAAAPHLASLSALCIGPYRFDPPIALAPMAGVSEAPYRVISLEMGAGFAPTELVSAKGLKFGNARTADYLRHDPAQESALCVQIFGGEPEAMAHAAELAVAAGARLLDVNMGCPVKKVTRTGAGSALMTDAARAAAIVAAMRARVGDRVPVTAKIRAGWDAQSINAPEVGRALEDAGLAAIAIHPRTRRQGYSGSADWSLIAQLKAAVQIPVIANGDIFSVEDAERVVVETECDAVMVGRAALGYPWIFRELAAARADAPPPPPPSAAERVALVQRHLAQHIEHIGDEGRALKKFRQHLIWYSRGMKGGGAFRDHAMRLEDRAPIEDAIEAFFGQTELSDRTEAPIYDERTAFG